MKLEILKATLSNRDEENRIYTFEGDVHVGKTGAVSVDNGNIYNAQGESIGTFSDYSDGNQLCINYQTKENRSAILEKVETFIGESKTWAAENMHN